MTIYSYHSTLIDDIRSVPQSVSYPSSQETVDSGSWARVSSTTSSQIFLSRGVAGSDEPATTPASTSQTTVASIFESDSSHIMTLGDAAAKTVSSQRGSHEESPRAAIDNICKEKIRLSSTADTTVQSSNSILSEPSPVVPSGDTSKDTHNMPSRRSPDCVSGRSDDTNRDYPPSSPSRWKGKGKEVIRGRSPEKETRSQNPLEKAESRTRKMDPAIQIDTRSIKKRSVNRSSTFFDNPYDLEAVLEDRILEPCPHIPICDNVSEVLDAPSESETISNIPLRRTNTAVSLGSLVRVPISRSRSVSASDMLTDVGSVYPHPTLHPERAARIYSKLDVAEQLTANKSLPSWIGRSNGIDLSPVPSAAPGSLASKLPAEIVQQIYLYLSPADFNTARHSCRSWFIHSLRQSLLELFLRRMGFSDAVCNNRSLGRATNDQDSASYEWSLSKRIARECALGPTWMGDGLGKVVTSKSETKSAFARVSAIDFTEVAVHYSGAKSTGTLFTVSNCGKFLMAANGCLIYVYELNRPHTKDDGDDNLVPGSLRPVTSIICPRRVLACSMDTSSHRYAVAILLDGRMGIVCEITALGAGSSSPESIDRSRRGSKFKDHSWDDTHGCGKTILLDNKTLKRTSESEKGRPCPGTPLAFSSLATDNPPFPSVNKSAWQDLFKDDTPESSSSTAQATRHIYHPRMHNIGLEKSNSSECTSQTTLPMPVEEGTRSLYRNLCSEDDPPRSVAICPQRRCVAFGCSSGIELHWVDALTGQNLNRWFPLTAPSDFLFFLPPRQNIDSAKKLRLISSAAKPNGRSAIAERHVGARSSSSPYWEEIGRELRRSSQSDRAEGSHGMNRRLTAGYGRRYTSGRMDASDHYRAIPLSDGYHILFTDPATGLLCLGSDAPLGGPTKLLRKIWFQGPEGKGTPITYSGGSDLTAGIRVVAAFESGEQQSIWLYSVPGDIFSTSQNEPSILAGSMMQPGMSKNDSNTDWMAWWPDDGLQEWLKHAQDPVPGVLPRSVWPVRIKGQEIGTCNGLADLTINSGPHMVVWAFDKDGLATVWMIGNMRDENVRSYLVARDGTVRETTDGSERSLSISSEPEMFTISPDSYDGTTSYGIQHHRVKRRRIVVTLEPSEPQLDADGDVIMTDADDALREESRYLVEEEFFRDLLVERKGRVRKTVNGDGAERRVRDRGRGGICVRVEELTGITRLDLEIH